MLVAGSFCPDHRVTLKSLTVRVSQGNVVTAGGSSGDSQPAVDTAAVQLAAQVLHAIVVQHRSLVRAALRNMPPLPSLAVLKEVNSVLIQVCCGVVCSLQPPTLLGHPHA